MKFIKVSLFLKVLVFIINLLLLINLLIIPKNIFGLINFTPFLLLLTNYLLFFYVLKNNRLAIKLFGLYLIILLIGIIYIYNIPLNINKNNYFIFVSYLLFLILIVLNLYFLDTNIKKGLKNLKTNLITSKNQAKRFIILNIIIIISIITFRFLYYDIEKDIEKIDKSFFVTKYEKIDIKDKDNLYISLKDFNYEDIIRYRDLKKAIVDCLYKDICFPIEYYQSMIDGGNKDQNNNFKVKSNNIEIKEGVYKTEFLNNLKEEKQIKEVQDFLNDNKELLFKFKNEENLNKEINNLINIYSKKKYFKVYINNNDDNNIFSYSGYIGSGFIYFNRDLVYKILYYLNNEQESKAIELIIAQIKTSLTILNGDGGMISKLYAMTTLRLAFNNLDLILNNFNLTEKSKNQLKNILSEDTDIGEIFSNACKNRYKDLLDSFYPPDFYYYNKTSFHDFSYTMKGLREIIFNTIKNKGGLSEDIILKYKDINYLKKNQIGQLIWKAHLILYKRQYNKIEDVIMKKENLLKKLTK